MGAFDGLGKKPEDAAEGDENKVTFAAIPQTDNNKPANEAEKQMAENQAEVLTEEGEARDQALESEAQLLSGAAADKAAEGENEPAERVWTSHPIQKFRVGGFEFEKATLRLTDPDKIAKFEEMLANSSARTRATVREISRAGADKIAAAFKSTSRVRGIDTSRPGPSGGGNR